MSLLAALFLAGCGGHDDDTSAAAEECPEALEMPAGMASPLGAWSSSFGQDFYDDSCSASGLDQTSESWINSFTLEGNAPEAMHIYFDPSYTSSTEVFKGVMDPGGGVTFTGVHAHASGTMYANFTGLMYYDQYTGRYVIDGSAFLGLDVDADGLIDCGAKGSWRALKSG